MDFERLKVKGPGNTKGGHSEFVIGLIMTIVGAYMALQNVRVTAGFWSFGGYGGHSSLGPLFGVLLLGVFFLFFDGSSWIGWLLTVGAATAMAVGFISSLRFHWTGSTALDALFVFGLPVAGLGILLGSLREH